MASRKTNRGQTIDIDTLFTENKNVPAIGNMNVNANGDVIDSKGNIVKKKEQRVREYYQNNPKSSTSTSIKGEQQKLQPDGGFVPPPKTAATAAASQPAPTPPPAPVDEPDEFGAPDGQEPIGYEEVELPSGDIEMVPVYRTDDE